MLVPALLADFLGINAFEVRRNCWPLLVLSVRHWFDPDFLPRFERAR